MDVRTALKEGIHRLRCAHVSSETLAAELLLLHVLGRERAWLYAYPEQQLTDADAERYLALIERRTAGQPAQHLTGKQEFWGLEFEVSPDVLIPRSETEHVVEVALDRLGLRELRAGRRQKTEGENLLIADVGTGSGCIAVALAKELPQARFLATDLSVSALQVAQRNAIRHGVASRVRFVEMNLLTGVAGLAVRAQHAVPLPRTALAQTPVPISGRIFDLIVSNPPYVGRREAGTLAREVREYEPELALYGGDEGYEIYGQLVQQAAERLKMGGLLVLELGHNSLPAVQPLLDPEHWTNVGITCDLAGITRVIAAEYY